MLIRTVQNQSATIKRWLGLLLVAFIFYGTTVEAAHRHGRILPPASQADALVDPGSNNGTFNTTPGCGECLICQLHQNFSATLLTIKPHSQELTRHPQLRTSDPVSVRSITSSPASGRAPPQAN